MGKGIKQSWLVRSIVIRALSSRRRMQDDTDKGSLWEES